MPIGLRPDRRRLPRWLAWSWAFLALASPAAAQTGTVTGRITDSRTGEGLAWARINVVNTAIGSSADSTGEYVLLNVPAGTLTIQARYIGYIAVRAQVTVTPGATTALDMSMEPVVLLELDVAPVGGGSPRLSLRPFLLFAALFLALELGRGIPSAGTSASSRRRFALIGATVAAAVLLLEIPPSIRYGLPNVWGLAWMVMDILWWWVVAVAALVVVDRRAPGTDRTPWPRAVRHAVLAALLAGLLVTVLQMGARSLLVGTGWYLTGLLLGAGNGAIVGAFVALHQALPPPWGQGEREAELAPA